MLLSIMYLNFSLLNFIEPFRFFQSYWCFEILFNLLVSTWPSLSRAISTVGINNAYYSVL